MISWTLATITDATAFQMAMISSRKIFQAVTAALAMITNIPIGPDATSKPAIAAPTVATTPTIADSALTKNPIAATAGAMTAAISTMFVIAVCTSGDKLLNHPVNSMTADEIAWIVGVNAVPSAIPSSANAL